MKPDRISLVRIYKQQQRKVSTVTVSKLMDKLKPNVGNNELAMIRFKVKNADPYLNDKHESIHRIYASACLMKSDNGALMVKDYTDMLLLSTSAIEEENRIAQLKQLTKVVPFTIATFIGSSGRTLKIIARVTCPTCPAVRTRQRWNNSIARPTGWQPPSTRRCLMYPCRLRASKTVHPQ